MFYETSLHAARQALTNKVGATAWLEGWALPAESAIEEVLMSEDLTPRLSPRDPERAALMGRPPDRFSQNLLRA